jgi:ubiquinone/menaquinone biosynthesis C-methylase UbiE
MIAVLKRPAVLLLVMILSTIAGLAQASRMDAADAERLIRALDVRPGSIVGEIGAGAAAELTIAMAKAVGDAGRIFTNDINKDRVRAIEEAVGQAGLKHVTVLEGRAAETGFPEQCCDAIFMRNVYHHFGDPPAMNASLLKSLKAGGRLAVIDFTPPPGGEAAPGGRGADNHHGITAPTLERELKAAGFEIVSSETKDRGVFVVARRPS